MYSQHHTPPPDPTQPTQDSQQGQGYMLPPDTGIHLSVCTRHHLFRLDRHRGIEGGAVVREMTLSESTDETYYYYYSLHLVYGYYLYAL
jgi:hypothetical protein